MGKKPVKKPTKTQAVKASQVTKAKSSRVARILGKLIK